MAGVAPTVVRTPQRKTPRSRIARAAIPAGGAACCLLIVSLQQGLNGGFQLGQPRLQIGETRFGGGERRGPEGVGGLADERVDQGHAADVVALQRLADDLRGPVGGQLVRGDGDGRPVAQPGGDQHIAGGDQAADAYRHLAQEGHQGHVVVALLFRRVADEAGGGGDDQHPLRGTGVDGQAAADQAQYGARRRRGAKRP